MYSYVNYYLKLFLFISICFSFSVGRITNVADDLTNAPAPAVNITGPPRPCQEETLARFSHTPVYSLDAVSLRHSGTLRRDSAGRRTYLELHLALQTAGYMGVYLSEKEEYWAGTYYLLYVGESSNQRTSLYYNGYTVQNVPTPNILSSTQFRSFFIKVDDGKLQFGKEGDAPLISYPGIDIGGSLNYYSFYSYSSSKFRFCAPAIEGFEQ